MPETASECGTRAKSTTIQTTPGFQPVLRFCNIEQGKRRVKPAGSNRPDHKRHKLIMKRRELTLSALGMRSLYLKRTPACSGGIVAVTSLALEARIALGPGVSVICSQGSYLAEHLESAIRRGVSGIISFGIAGGLAPGLVAGQWVAAAAIKTAEQSLVT